MEWRENQSGSQPLNGLPLSQCGAAPRERQEGVSIPRRCDWKSWRRLGLQPIRHQISIPQRCDWKIRSLLHAPRSRLHFNTSKVRLEVVAARPRRTTAIHFNTSKVRLEAAASTSCASGASRFQYLKGAIGSSAQRAYAAVYQNFNTSKVRLEDLGLVSL